MKTRVILLIALIYSFAGCDLLKKATEVTINTQLKSDIPIVVSAVKKSFDITGNLATVTFTQSQDLTLSSNTDIEPYLAKIKSIDLKSLVVTVTGLTAGQTISTVSLDVAGVGNIFIQASITMDNNSFTPTIQSGILNQVASKLTADKKVTFTLSGAASGPMSFTVSLNFDAGVTAAAL